MHKFFLRGGFKIICFCCLFFMLFCVSSGGYARSVHSPRHSGLEPPGGPRPMEALPGGRSIDRTAEGGRGYTDAYGNTVERKMPEARQERRRLSPGAYGAPRKAGGDAGLPDVGADEKPLWQFDR